MSMTGRQAQVLARAALARPGDPDELHRFVKLMLGHQIPRRALMAGSDAPFDYLVHSYFEGGPSADVVVWANRGGGKTFLGAVATLLDMLFKPGIGVCILGGSFEQSSRMYSHLLKLLRRRGVRGMVAREPTRRQVTFINGSRVEVLCQSQRSVRGLRVERLRCDEVELFDPDVWEAAQLVTRSRTLGGVEVRGGIEALSTMHQPFGLMSKLVERRDVRVLRWGAMDVAARCEPNRPCESCVLWRDCQGRAKEADGFVSIDDLVAQRHRSGDEQWDAEMMCRRPSRRHAVFGELHERHVIEATAAVAPSQAGQLIAGMDFGLRNPLAMVWAVATRRGDDPLQWPVEVIDEYCGGGLTLDEHLRRIDARGHDRPAWIGVDPAGRAVNAQTGRSDIQCLQRRGHVVRSRPAAVRDGIDIIRRRLDRGTLTLRRHCTQLIDAMRRYHYDPQRPDSEAPVKDGPDHLCDALRYMLVCLERGGGAVKTRLY